MKRKQRSETIVKPVSIIIGALGKNLKDLAKSITIPEIRGRIKKNLDNGNKENRILRKMLEY